MPTEFLKSTLLTTDPEFLQGSWQTLTSSKPPPVIDEAIPERRPNKLVFLISNARTSISKM